MTRDTTATSRRTWGLLALVLLVTAAIYSTSVRFTAVNYDDPIYVLYVYKRAADGLGLDDLGNLLIDIVNANWHPVTLVSFYLDYYVHGLSAGGMHLHNGLLHVLNTFLVFLLVRRLVPGRDFVHLFTATLFALHPVNVGAVGWIAERKGLLSATFAFLSMLQYLRYRERGQRGALAASIVLFTLSVLSKATSVVLPVALILVDWYRYGDPLVPRRRADLARALRNKWIYFAIALVVGLLTVRAHGMSGALSTTDVMTLYVRIGNFLLSLPAYFRMLLLPKDFAFYYPFVRDPALLPVAASALFMVAVTVAAIAVRRRFPHLLFAVLWMLIWLAPLSGIVKSGPHFLADRYMYIAALGLFIAMAHGLDMLRHLGRRRLAQAVGLAFAAVISVVTAIHLQFWRSPISLYTHALDITGPNVHAESNLATYYARFGDTERALKHFRNLIGYARYSFPTYKILGEVLVNQGHHEAAEEVVEAGLEVYPGDPRLLAIKSEVLRATGRTEEAIALCRQALQQHPDMEIFAVQLGRLHAARGERQLAAAYYEQALALNPEHRWARRYLEDLQKDAPPDGGPPATAEETGPRP